jgi:hypothetical protein
LSPSFSAGTPERSRAEACTNTSLPPIFGLDKAEAARMIKELHSAIDTSHGGFLSRSSFKQRAVDSRESFGVLRFQERLSCS